VMSYTAVAAALSSASLSWLCGHSIAVTAAIAAIAALSAAVTWKYRQLREEVKSGASARLVWCPPTLPGLSDRRKFLAGQISSILEQCSSLRCPEYQPPVFASGVWSNLVLYGIKQAIDKNWWVSPHKRQRIVCPDGGVVSIDWADDKVTASLPADAPIVIFLHTVTGSVKETSHYLRTASHRGWRSCVFNRRGHGGEHLRTGSFNVIGDVSDTSLQAAGVKAAFPSAYIAMVGISAGAGLLVTYLGKVGEDTPVMAAAALCPAYEISEAFKVKLKYGRVDNHVLKSMKRLFIQSNEEILSRTNSEAVLACKKARSIHEFVNAHAAFAGFGSCEEYYAANNPVGHVQNVCRPMLIINSDDDVISLKENMREDVVKLTGGALLLRTKRGSHISFNEGLFGTGCFISRMAMDFIQAAKKINDQEAKSNTSQ